MSLSISPRKPYPCPISILSQDALVSIFLFAHADLKEVKAVCRSFRIAARKASFAPSIQQMMRRAFVIDEKNIVAAGYSKGFLTFVMSQDKREYLFSAVELKTGSVLRERFRFYGILDPSIYYLKEMGFVFKEIIQDQYLHSKHLISYFFDFHTHHFIEIKMFDELRGIYVYALGASLIVVERGKMPESYPIDTSIYSKVLLVEEDQIFLGHCEFYHGLIICRLTGKQTRVDRYKHGKVIPIPDGYLIDKHHPDHKKFVVGKDLLAFKVKYSGFSSRFFNKCFYADGRVFGFNNYYCLEYRLKTRQNKQTLIPPEKYHPIRFVKVSFPLVAFGFYNEVSIWNLSSKISLFTKHFGHFVRIEALFFDQEALTVLLSDRTIHTYTQMDILKSSELESHFEKESSFASLTAARAAKVFKNGAFSTLQLTKNGFLNLMKWVIPPEIKLYKSII